MFSLAAHRSFLVCSGLRAFQLGRCADRVPLERPIVSQFDDVYCRAYPAKGCCREHFHCRTIDNVFDPA
jgi:hypothetical protein